jgi:glycosyltransferase involved in cell wall biosynthesis
VNGHARRLGLSRAARGAPPGWRYDRAVRVLHVGWGFFPWRRGGLINYAEDLMAAQVRGGHRVAYFFSGRHYPRLSGPRLKRWRRGDVEMHEVVNGPMVSGLELGTRTPDLELDEPRIEAAFRRVLRSFRPDVVHFQELLCLPSSLIDVAREDRVATVMTLQDYLPLCATIRLFDADGRICERLEVGEDCALRNARAPASRQPFIVDTYEYEAWRWHRNLRVGRVVPEGVYHFVSRRIHGWSMRQVAREPPIAGPRDPAAAFQRRRDVNVERLGRVGRLVAQSPRVAEIYAARGVAPERITTLRFTLAHIERLRPRSLSSPPSPIAFTTLGGCASPSKGSELIVAALRELRAAGLEGSFRLRVLGGIDGAVRPELEGYRGVELGEPGELYDRHRLDALLEGVDVGIMPSIWEEAFGYSGLEMIAKGIPLIANPLGGIAEYAREGETAWLNESCSAEGLADLMARLIADPRRVVELHERVLAARDRLVRPMAEHVEAIEATYRQADAGAV